MINQHYIHPDDARIEKKELNIELYDADGELRFSFPYGFSDAHIQVALAFANKAYRDGQRTGRENFRYELRELIGAPHTTADGRAI